MVVVVCLRVFFEARHQLTDVKVVADRMTWTWSCDLWSNVSEAMQSVAA